MRSFVPLVALAALLPLAGCDTAQPVVECPTAADCVDPGTADEVVAGVNLTALFAAPTAAERDSVAARLARTGGTDAARVTQVVPTDLATDADGTRYTRLALRDSTGQAVAYAVARIPAASVGAGERLPVLFILPDRQGDASEASFITGQTARGLDRTTVQIALAARGATLTTRGAGPTSAPIVTASAAPADPYRADVLDLLVLSDPDLIGIVGRVDPSRQGAIGVGRGAAVALLAAERAPGRFRSVASLSAPTSLFDPTFRTDVRRALAGGPASTLPAADALLAPVRLLSQGRISLAEARLRMLELSPVALADRLPAAFILHAQPDELVPFAHFQRIRELGSGSVAAPRRFEIADEVPHDALLSTNSVRALFATFFDATL